MIQGEQNRGRARNRIVWKEALSAKFGAKILLSGGRELDGDTLPCPTALPCTTLPAPTPSFETNY